MNEHKRGWFLVLAALLIVVLVGGTFAYRALSGRYAPETPESPAAQSNADSEMSYLPGNSLPEETTEEQTMLAPDFFVEDADGNTVRLADVLDAPIIVNFWASWCPPCKAELPCFEAAYLDYGDQIRFMMVDLADGYQETKSAASDFVAENGYTFPVYFDTTGSTVTAYGLSAIPVTAAINGRGELLRLQVGGMSEESLQSMIELLLEDAG